MSLHTSSHGNGPPLVLLHGFTTSGAAWAPLLPYLTEHRRALCVDLPGHGASPAPNEGYTFTDCLDSLSELLDREAIDTCDVWGYSMGGRIALAWACKNEQRVRQLVLESTSPGIAAEQARDERLRGDRELANSIEQQPFTEFIDHWMALPLFAGDQPLADGIRQHSRALRLTNRPSAVAASLRALGTGRQPSYWRQLPKLHCPVLLLTGERDEKFGAIAAAMHDSLPDSIHRTIAGAAHTPHLEQPSRVTGEVLGFLRNSNRAEARSAS